MSDQSAYTGEIRLFGFSYAPRDWAFCNGVLLAIAEHTALFSLLGTNFGGDGRTNFGLPELRGRVPIHQGQGPTLSPYYMGQPGGAEAIRLTLPQIPSHTHAPRCSDQPGNQQVPSGAVPADEGHAGFQLYQTTAEKEMQPTSAAGGDQPHYNLQPFLVVNYCICLDGIYPPRS